MGKTQNLVLDNADYEYTKIEKVHIYSNCQLNMYNVHFTKENTLFHRKWPKIRQFFKQHLLLTDRKR